MISNENNIGDLIPLPLPNDILYIIHTFTRQRLPDSLINDIHNYVYHLKQIEYRNKKYKTSEMLDVVKQQFTKIQVQHCSSFYTSTLEYIQYSIELYPNYPSFNTILSRSFFTSYHLHERSKVFEKYIQQNPKHNREMYTCHCDDNCKLFCQCYESYSKRIFRIILGLCHTHERDMLFTTT